MFKRILIALDKPQADHAAFRAGLGLAALAQGQVQLFHSLFPGEGGAPMPPGGDVFFVPGYIPDASTFESYQHSWADHCQRNQEALEALTQLPEAAAVAAIAAVQIQGTPGRSICEAAAAWPADLIVMGRRHQSVISELFMGSVSSYVLHHAPCAVMVVPD